MTETKDVSVQAKKSSENKQKKDEEDAPKPISKDTSLKKNINVEFNEASYNCLAFTKKEKKFFNKIFLLVVSNVLLSVLLFLVAIMFFSLVVKNFNKVLFSLHDIYFFVLFIISVALILTLIELFVYFIVHNFQYYQMKNYNKIINTLINHPGVKNE